MTCKTIRQLARTGAYAATTAAVAVLTAAPAQAAEPDPTAQLKTIIGHATAWLVGISATVATFFFTVGGIRHMLAGGDPGEIEKAKGSYKSAAMGYALAALAPLVAAILKGILGVS